MLSDTNTSLTMGKKSKTIMASIRGENRTEASYKANPYMTPSLAPRRWSAWMSNIFIALCLVVAGIVLLAISPDMEGNDLYLGGWVCIAVGSAFLLLGFCWYKNITSHEEAEKLVDDTDVDDHLPSPTSLNTSTTRLSEDCETGSGTGSRASRSPPMSPPKPPPTLPPPGASALRAHPDVRRASGQTVRFQQPPVYQYK